MGERYANTTMIKSTLIDSVAKKLAHLPEEKVNNAINFIIALMSDSLAAGKRIEIRGFGSFSLHFRPPRNAHNPKTGERVITVPKYSPHFKPGKELRERVNNNRHLPIQKESGEE